MLNETDLRNKAAQIRIAKALFSLADINKGKPDQLDLLHDIAEAIYGSQFWFLDWLGIESYLYTLAHGEITFPEDDPYNESRTPGFERIELRAQIEADIAKTETELPPDMTDLDKM